MTAAFNPYDILSVARNATPEDIKKAFRRLAKDTHPDRGGDRSAFERVNLAHEVLADPERRTKYDTTGEIEESVIGNLDGEAMGLISQILTEIIDRDGRDPLAFPLIAIIEKTCREHIQEADDKLAALRRSKERTARISKRFKRKKSAKGGPNLFESLIAHKLREIDTSIGKVEKIKAPFARAIEMIADYEFQPDLPTSRPMGVLDDKWGAWEELMKRSK